jgi:hypothetical protein
VLGGEVRYVFHPLVERRVHHHKIEAFGVVVRSFGLVFGR